ncbi:hypothetical protein BKA82DRAFT_1003526 [Pisolithus tinctorius]|uniref:Uncharacterized protein n=1 Tax=Pisolithus tinctorius Marx 270 TaxID=870435 RepID=A0A0C3NIJ5_PISTI|nr:hypothetical protein BKA82DRAFT_1003526 [Pisolithus tinctorius]KIO00810.1 hypothetical protein M404DRAFT_1003526 [Pisolithus tinctorius Marx 270]
MGGRSLCCLPSSSSSSCSRSFNRASSARAAASSLIAAPFELLQLFNGQRGYLDSATELRQRAADESLVAFLVQVDPRVLAMDANAKTLDL